jgi:metallo-beta-lactamase family protein
MESTYGNRNHRDRKISLQELENFVLRSIQEKRDIFIPILALERPIYVLYELLQICKRNKINPNSLDIGYLG